MAAAYPRLTNRLRGMCSLSFWRRGMIMSGYTLQFKIWGREILSATGDCFSTSHFRRKWMQWLLPTAKQKNSDGNIAHGFARP